MTQAAGSPAGPDAATPGGQAAEPGRVEVHHDAEQQSWVLTVAGEPAGRLATRLVGDTVVAHHTEVDPALGGRGLGHRLVAATLADVCRRGLRAVPWPAGGAGLVVRRRLPAAPSRGRRPASVNRRRRTGAC